MRLSNLTGLALDPRLQGSRGLPRRNRAAGGELPAGGPQCTPHSSRGSCGDCDKPCSGARPAAMMGQPQRMQTGYTLNMPSQRNKPWQQAANYETVSSTCRTETFRLKRVQEAMQRTSTASTRDRNGRPLMAAWWLVFCMRGAGQVRGGWRRENDSIKAGGGACLASACTY